MAHLIFREATLLSLCVLGATLFLHHQVLYLDGAALSVIPGLAYPIAAGVLYVFVRSITLVAAMRVPHASDPGRCPECGQWLDDGTPVAVHSRHREAVDAKPVPVSRVARPTPAVTSESTPTLRKAAAVNPAIEALLFQDLVETARTAYAEESHGLVRGQDGSVRHRDAP